MPRRGKWEKRKLSFFENLKPKKKNFAQIAKPKKRKVTSSVFCRFDPGFMFSTSRGVEWCPTTPALVLILVLKTAKMWNLWFTCHSPFSSNHPLHSRDAFCGEWTPRDMWQSRIDAICHPLYDEDVQPAAELRINSVQRRLASYHSLMSGQPVQ